MSWYSKLFPVLDEMVKVSMFCVVYVTGWRCFVTSAF